MFEWEDDFDQYVLNRGWRYAREGAIQYITKKGSRIEAVVRGSEYYRVQIVYDGHSIEEAHCTCPYAAGGNRCKHTVYPHCVAPHPAWKASDRWP